MTSHLLRATDKDNESPVLLSPLVHSVVAHVARRDSDPEIFNGRYLLLVSVSPTTLTDCTAISRYKQIRRELEQYMIFLSLD